MYFEQPVTKTLNFAHYTVSWCHLKSRSARLLSTDTPRRNGSYFATLPAHVMECTYGQLCMYICMYTRESSWNPNSSTLEPDRPPRRSRCRPTVCVRRLHCVVLSFPCKDKEKGKVHPRTGHEGAEVEKRYSCTLSLTSALDGSGWSTPRPDRFTPGKETWYPLYRRLGGPKDRSGRVRKISHRDLIPGPSRS